MKNLKLTIQLGLLSALALGLGACASREPVTTTTTETTVVKRPVASTTETVETTRSRY